MAITIRRLGPDDVEQFRACRRDMLRDNPTAFYTAYEEEEPWSLEIFRKKFLDSGDLAVIAAFGAFDGEHLIGTTRIYQEDRIKRRHKMNVVGVFVKPEYRGQRISSRLIEVAIAYARTVEGIERIELSVESRNAVAKALYASFGFETWGTEPALVKYEGAYYDADYMTLKL